MINKKTIKNILNGQWQIYEEDKENRYVYYTQMSFTWSYGEWYFYNEEKSFKLRDLGKKWFIQK